MTTAESASPTRPPRRPAIDVARGTAVAAMVVYHIAWDLSELHFIHTDIRDSAGWSSFARAIAASFLVLVGVSLVLAHGRGIRAAPFLRRTALVAAAAAAVTVGSWIAFPDSYIFFGILHNIVLSSCLALPFVRAPAVATAGVAAAVLATPLLVAAPAFDHALLVPLGLGTGSPVTNDFVPVFPWTGFVLAGVAAARAGRSLLDRLGAGAAPGRIGRLLALAGRHSLAVYLLHQPVIFGSLLALRQLLGPDPAAEAAPFLRSCVAACRAAGQAAAVCGPACDCSVDELKRDGLWVAVVAGRTSPGEQERTSALARACLKKVAPAG